MKKYTSVLQTSFVESVRNIRRDETPKRVVETGSDRTLVEQKDTIK